MVDAHPLWAISDSSERANDRSIWIHADVAQVHELMCMKLADVFSSDPETMDTKFSGHTRTMEIKRKHFSSRDCPQALPALQTPDDYI